MGVLGRQEGRGVTLRAPVEAGIGDRSEAGNSSGPKEASSPHKGQRERDGMGGALGTLRYSGVTSCLNQDSLCTRSCPPPANFCQFACPPKASLVPYLIHLLNKFLLGICYVLASFALGTENSVMNKQTFLPSRRAHRPRQGKEDR